jgi:hypothetical protein
MIGAQEAGFAQCPATQAHEQQPRTDSTPCHTKGTAYDKAKRRPR